MLKKWKVGSFLISLSVFICFLNGYVTAQPTDEQLEAFRSVKTVRIIVDQSYSEAEGVSLPFEEVTKRFLESAGLKVVGSDVKMCDATLRIEAEGEALGASYRNFGYQYTGAKLSGDISFEIPGVLPYKKFFEGTEPVPLGIVVHMGALRAGWENPSNAPFKRAFNSSFYGKLAEMAGELYSSKVLIDCWSSTLLEDGDWKAREKAARALGEIGDERAVESLITALLEDESGCIRATAAEALGEIGDERATEPLKQALKDESKYVQVWSAFGLYKLGNTQGIEFLITALEDEGKSVRVAAAEALEKITGEDFSEDPVKWQEWWEKNKAK